MSDQLNGYEHYEQLFLDLEKAKLERLVADSAVAEAKRGFHEDHVALKSKELHALYATQNAAEIKVQELKILALKAKLDAKRLKGKSFAFLLAKKVEAAGMTHLIDEAQAESLQAVTDAGLHVAYSMKGPA